MSKVTHFVYDGMLLHVVGSREEVLNRLYDALDVLFISLPVLGHDGKVQDLTFSLMGSMIVMDDHEASDLEKPKAFELPSVAL